MCVRGIGVWGCFLRREIEEGNCGGVEVVSFFLGIPGPESFLGRHALACERCS